MLPPPPWFVCSIRLVAVGLLLLLPVLLAYAFRIGAALGAWQVWAFLIYSGVTLAVVFIGLGVPLQFWGHDGKRGMEIMAGDTS
ncbi:MAG: hypothetical protein JWN51_3804 [Phycisphaerales bacterium]|nr:hypothetical protein [Phycisphaerales bacterium]